MKRITTKIGDVFSVKKSDDLKVYFQFVISDQTQLNSDVIRVFQKTYPIQENPDLNIIVNKEVEFYGSLCD